MATFCPFFLTLCYELENYVLIWQYIFEKSYLLNILYEKRIKVVFVLESE